MFALGLLQTGLDFRKEFVTYINIYMLSYISKSL